MPQQKVAEFSIDRLQIVDERGNVDEKLWPVEMDSSKIRQIFESMTFARILDATMLRLQREGRCGTYASSEGQEATQIGAALALNRDDWIFPYFRELGAWIVRGYPLEKWAAYWAWDERGMADTKAYNMFMLAIPVSTQIPHATGFAWGLKKRKEKKVVLCFLGDGATSKGDFAESLNFAGVFKIPIVYVCLNNQWAISVPRSRQSAAETLAQKAVAAGIEDIQVDGNDVFAVYNAAKEAADRARKGKGPTLIECVTYRLGDHTTSDDAVRYRASEDVSTWRAKEPLVRLRKLLQARGAWDEGYQKKVEADAQAKVDAAIKKMEAMPRPPIEDIFNYMYAKPTPELSEQLSEAKKFYGDKR
jgi:pyruvate dehydrogenase E1 component alpha subunit